MCMLVLKHFIYQFLASLYQEVKYLPSLNEVGPQPCEFFNHLWLRVLGFKLGEKYRNVEQVDQVIMVYYTWKYKKKFWI